MTNAENLPSPIEVWLSQPNIGVMCTEVHEDESTRMKRIRSLSMRGAQREVAGYYIGLGYEPVGRWKYTDGDQSESMRRFALPIGS